MATFKTVNEKRSKNWLKNALRYRYMRVFPGKRDRNLWIFSAWEGEKYSDNSKYLFEYMIKNQPQICCVWQTKNEKVYKQLKKEKYNVQLIGTKIANETQKKAGVALYTNGLDDFGDFPLIYGAKLISLWHGVGFKKIYRLLCKQSNNELKKLYSKWKWEFFSWVKRDLTIVTSEYTINQFAQWFDLSEKDKIVIAGQSRNDVFAQDIKLNKVIQNKELGEKIQGKYIILYMPTFRKEDKILSSHLDKIYHSERLEKILDKYNAVFIGKLHYLNKGKIESQGNKILLNDRDVNDPQQLIACADMMITDYSSCVVDYALTNKPVLYYFPDWEEFKAEQTTMPETKKACSVNCVYDVEEFIDRIEEMLFNPGRGVEQSKVLNKYFDDTGVEPGHFCENNFLKIQEFLKTESKY